MKHLSASVLYLMLAATACQKEATEPVPSIQDGTYTGTFQRQVDGSGPVANVTITFSGNSWTGQSQTPKYPGLCRGTYTITDNSHVQFINQCDWTAEFDWTLILTSNYTFKATDNTLEIVREVTGPTTSYKDIYRLSK